MPEKEQKAPHLTSLTVSTTTFYKEQFPRPLQEYPGSRIAQPEHRVGTIDFLSLKMLSTSLLLDNPHSIELSKETHWLIH